MNQSNVGFIALAAAGMLGLAACGEQTQVVQYQKGQYQGKADARPWENANFANDKTKWDGAIRARGQMQNEYKRTGD